MDKLQRDWAELKRQTLMSPAHLRALPFSPSATTKPPLTSLRWRLYLDILPIECFGHEDDECARVWGMAIEKERNNYTLLRTQFIVDPDALPKEGVDWERMNPLSLDENSPWQRYHRDQELRTTIMQDVARTFPEHKYFRRAAVQQWMADILFVYAKIHSSLQYRQGMHELLAPLLMAVDADAVISGEVEECVLAKVVDRKFVEHDAFALFDRLMRVCTPWYQAPSITSPPLRATRHRQNHNSPPASTGSRAWRRRSSDNARAQTPIIAQCHLMMEKLALVDTELASHLLDLDIEPQLFGIRWYRLLFSRELAHLGDVFALWDALLADNTAGMLKLVDWVSVVLLLANRRRLLQGDYSDCLATLLHIPPLPRPSMDTLERTPALQNSPLPPEAAVVPGTADVASALVPKLPFAALTLPHTTPVQRLALQAAYLRGRPTAEAAALITRQYELWEEDAWDIVGADGGAEKERGSGSAVEDHPLLQPPDEDRGKANSDIGANEPKPARPRANSGRTPPANMASSIMWNGRKRYTSSTLQQMRANGGVPGSTSPSSSKSISPSPLLSNCIPAAVTNDKDAHEDRKASLVLSEGDDRTPGETIRALGSLTAQASSIAAQCLDLLSKRIPDAAASAEDGERLSALGAALYTVSRVWQDEVVRSSVSEEGSPFNTAANAADRIRPREVSEIDMRVVLRDLDNVYISLSKLK
ncbi:RabGAP/TBC [Martensiomyces pterosporus]|nr:RabGAP/TBC [Martensiomyces pterosporus]